MTKWMDRPPTYDEWMDAKNHGVWWVKFMLTPATTEMIDGEVVTFPEAWYTTVVTITSSYTSGQLFDKSAARLHAQGDIVKSFYLDDKQRTKGIYWQPVASPVDDITDQRPEC